MDRVRVTNTDNKLPIDHAAQNLISSTKCPVSAPGKSSMNVDLLETSSN